METFQKLLDEAHPPALHEALHSFAPKKYKHGAFPEDRTAVEFIHKEEPSVATSIVNLARRQNVEVVDLNKRQDNGTTTTNAPPTPNPQTTTNVTPVPPISEGSTLSQISATESSPGPNTTPVVSTTSSGVPVSSSAISTSVAGASTSVTPSTSNVASTTRNPISLTAGEIITTTNAVGLTIISTVGGGASTVSPSNRATISTNTHKGAAPTSVVVQTSTLPNGSQSVVTAVTVVGAGGSEGAGDTPTGTAGVGPSSTSGSPGLQTGEAVMSRGWGKEMVLVVGGAVAFAGMM